MGLVPMMAAAAVVQMQMLNGSYGDADDLDGGASAGVILGGALNGITTVTAFNMQETTAKRYEEVKGNVFAEPDFFCHAVFYWGWTFLGNKGQGWRRSFAILRYRSRAIAASVCLVSLWHLKAASTTHRVNLRKIDRR